MSPPTNSNTSITATDNPSTTTAFLLGQLVSKIDSLDKKVDAVTTKFDEKVAHVTAEIESLKNFRLKMIAIVSAICATINIPGWINLFTGM